MLSLVHVVEWRASVNPDQIAISDDRGAELTYAGLRMAMEASAAAFAAAGAAPGFDSGELLSWGRERLAGYWAGRDRRDS